METCKSPRTVMLLAYELAAERLPDYSSKFSRKDFTLPQLFACLVVREQLKLSYRKIEALLRDSESWWQPLGMTRVPDHNTLCRAFAVIVKEPTVDHLLTVMIQRLDEAKVLGDTCAIDSTLHDTHHRSRHYEQRCRHHAKGDKNAEKAMRSATAKKTPKLTISIDTRTHIIYAAHTKTGMGSDAPTFLPLLRQTRTRHPSLRFANADAGFDSHENHRVAREELRVRTRIKTGCGRPSSKPPKSKYRRQMQRELAGSQKGKPFGQRAQVETVTSMLKRNLTDHLRARTQKGRRMEQLLKVLTHNLMIIKRRNRGSRQSRTQLVSDN
jgi:hypothetical protein